MNAKRQRLGEEHSGHCLETNVPYVPRTLPLAAIYRDMEILSHLCPPFLNDSHLQRRRIICRPNRRLIH